METPDQNTLVRAAQAGDQMAFEILAELYRRELIVHCYRMLGSLHDAEDLVQETLDYAAVGENSIAMRAPVPTDTLGHQAEM